MESDIPLPQGKQKLRTHLSLNVRREAPVIMRSRQDRSTLPMRHRLKIGSCQTCPIHREKASTSRASNENNPLASHLQMQPIPNGFRILEIAIFGPASDSMGHVVNYNIHMDLRTTSEGLKCRAFSATLDEEGKMWFSSLAPGCIASFKQLTNLFEARFSN
ncbi:hypothetical protein ACLOJK_004451 [Asimina triloba]